MKQMNLLRVGVLLVAALFVVGAFTTGGFAKYITGNQGHDEARVAMFGVTLEVGGNSFGNQYTGNVVENFLESLDNTVTVYTETDALVAPGTSSNASDGTQATFGINGTPEVAVAVNITFDETTKDVFLAEGTYTDYTHVNSTTGTYSDTFEVPEGGYYPVKYTLSQNVSGTYQPIKGATNVTLKEIGTFLSDYSKSATYGPGVDLNAEFAFDWAWDFEVKDGENANATIDAADTLLGMLADKDNFTYMEYDSETGEGTVVLIDDKFSTNLAYNLSVSVEQID